MIIIIWIGRSIVVIVISVIVGRINTIIHLVLLGRLPWWPERILCYHRRDLRINNRWRKIIILG